MYRIYSILFLALFSFQIFSQTSDPCPCCGSEYRQFDFWLGEWNVTNNGKLAGTNTITLTEGNCVLKESWKSATGNYTGTSNNFYDQRTKTWHQTWIDNQGGNLLLEGRFQNGSMVLMDEPSFDAQGDYNINKITWTPNADGTVRQHWELSSDLGKTWSTLFDGIYAKKANTQTKN